MKAPDIALVLHRFARSQRCLLFCGKQQPIARRELDGLKPSSWIAGWNRCGTSVIRGRTYVIRGERRAPEFSESILRPILTALSRQDGICVGSDDFSDGRARSIVANLEARTISARGEKQ
jgi:hypothetical protein